jgi:hypothetical protein
VVRVTVDQLIGDPPSLCRGVPDTNQKRLRI